MNHNLKYKAICQNCLKSRGHFSSLKRAWIVFSVFLITAGSLQTLSAQENFLFDRLNIEDGLSNNSINWILQTNDGFLWIATKDGLNRYDGQGFKVFKNISAVNTSLPENYVMTLMESSSKIFYVGTWGGGLCRYDPINENFVPIRCPDSKDEFVQCFYEDTNKNIWFGTSEGGLFRFTPGSGEILNFSKSKSQPDYFPSDNIMCIEEDTPGKLWVATWDSGLIRFDTDTWKYKQFRHDPNDKSTISANGIWHIAKDTGNSILLSTISGIDRFNTFTEKCSTDPNFVKEYKSIGPISIRQILKDRKGRTWIGTYDYFGLHLLDHGEDGSIKNYRFINEDDNQQSISMDRIRYLYEDNKANIWIGTEDGLDKVPVHQPFIQYRHLPVRSNSLGGRVVSSILEARDKTLWVGFGGGGFDRLNLQKEQISHFTNNPSNSNSLSNNDVISIYETLDGKFWICTMFGGLNCYDPNTGKFMHYTSNPLDSKSIRLDWVNQVLETNDGVFLIGTNSGLDILDRESDSFMPFKAEVIHGQKELPPTISVNALFEDSRRCIWIGSWLDGVYCYNPSEKSLTQYLHNDDDANSVSSNKITCFLEDSHRNIWMGTHSGGLNKLDIRSGTFTHYNTQNGLPNDVVFGIQEDSNSNLWVSTMNGLVRFNPSTGLIRVYDQLDGLVHNQFNWRASFKNSEGYLFFGGINGFVSFHPDSVKIDTIPPLVAITSFIIFNRKTALSQYLPATKEIELEHDQNFFSIGFTALDMAPNEKHKYAYMLEGIDPDWVYSGTRTTAFYTDLRPGTFSFLFRASNADDAWSEPVSLSITILPAWWNTWWMKLAGLLAIFGIGILVTRIRFWHLLEIERIRLTIASDLHDEMGSNLSSISVDSQQLMRNKKINSEGFELASDIYKTTNETIDSIRDIIWFINPKNDGGENTVFKMKEKAASLLAGIRWTFEISDDLHLDSIKLEARRNIFLIYKEALTNIVRHSSASSCTIKLEKKINSLQMSICDNGDGFNIADTKKHGGLENIYYRAKKIHAEVDITSEKGKGTCLILKLAY
jgi:ligand-binding sensor domain-containing protein